MRLPFLSRREQVPVPETPVIDLHAKVFQQCATTDCLNDAQLQYKWAGAFAGLCGVTVYFCESCYRANVAKKAARSRPPQGEQA